MHGRHSKRFRRDRTIGSLFAQTLVEQVEQQR
jgi:hypothetical protein